MRSLIITMDDVVDNPREYSQNKIVDTLTKTDDNDDQGIARTLLTMFRSSDTDYLYNIRRKAAASKSLY